VNADRLSQDPTFRLIGSKKILERGAALTSRLQSFETGVLTQEDNLAGLAALNRELVARVEGTGEVSADASWENGHFCTLLAGGETGAFRHRWEHRGAMPAETLQRKAFSIYETS
jgi:hypothetical protein